MKKILTFVLLVAMLCVCLCGCIQSDSSENTHPVNENSKNESSESSDDNTSDNVSVDESEFESQPDVSGDDGIDQSETASDATEDSDDTGDGTVDDHGNGSGNGAGDSVSDEITNRFQSFFWGTDRTWLYCQEFVSDELTYADIMDVIFTTGRDSGLCYQCGIENERIEKDPVSIELYGFECGSYGYSANDIDWIANNVFGFEGEIDHDSENIQNVYFSNDKFHLIVEPSGGPGNYIESSSVKAEALANGKYKFTVEAEVYEEYGDCEYVGTEIYEFVASLETDDEKGDYWRIYSFDVISVA